VHFYFTDIDAICLAHHSISSDDFFTGFKAKLREINEICDLLAITDTPVPILRMKFRGIKFDLLFARADLN